MKHCRHLLSAVLHKCRQTGPTLTDITTLYTLSMSVGERIAIVSPSPSFIGEEKEKEKEEKRALVSDRD